MLGNGTIAGRPLAGPATSPASTVFLLARSSAKASSRLAGSFALALRAATKGASSSRGAFSGAGAFRAASSAQSKARASAALALAMRGASAGKATARLTLRLVGNLRGSSFSKASGALRFSKGVATLAAKSSAAASARCAQFVTLLSAVSRAAARCTGTIASFITGFAEAEIIRVPAQQNTLLVLPAIRTAVVPPTPTTAMQELERPREADTRPRLRKDYIP